MSGDGRVDPAMTPTRYGKRPRKPNADPVAAKPSVAGPGLPISREAASQRTRRFSAINSRPSSLQREKHALRAPTDGLQSPRLRRRPCCLETTSESISLRSIARSRSIALLRLRSSPRSRLFCFQARNRFNKTPRHDAFCAVCSVAVVVVSLANSP